MKSRRLVGRMAARDAARMTFMDVIEMVCDWWGARKGYGDTRTWKSPSS